MASRFAKVNGSNVWISAREYNLVGSGEEIICG